MYKLNRITGSTIKASGQTDTETQLNQLLQHQNQTTGLTLLTTDREQLIWENFHVWGPNTTPLEPCLYVCRSHSLVPCYIKDRKNSCFVMALPPTLLLNLFIWKLNSCLKAEKGFLTSGCAKWLLCASRAITLMSLSNIIFM